VEYDFLSWSLTNSTGDSRSGVNELNLYNLSIGVFPRVNLAYGKKVNPYIFTEITFNYTDINYVNKILDAWLSLGGTEDSFNEWFNNLTTPAAFRNTPQSSFGIGLYPGVGLDFNVTQNLGIYLQGGYSFISINKSDMEAANLEPENFKTIKVELGVKLSFLRSKDI
jgi:opacity protein-like surface antigen